MGHVDHGKTSLLDAIRKADVASKEAGGITQHIGAYHVTLPSGQKVVFLDTPGHEAFTAMRSRGARITDIVILLVAADDGVMAQTREAIDHARAAKVPIIVAINKIDKPGANPEKVKRELAELGLIPEEWGGDTICINISAKEKTGIEELLEMMVFQAEVMELKADPKRPARGHAIEARLDKGRGAVATLLISEGTLHVGDALVCGIHHGRVRAMFNDKGEKIKIAGPSMPVEIQGLSGVPDAGNEFTVLSDDKKAREISEYRQRKSRETELAKSSKVSLENVFEKLQEQELKELNIVLKVDVQGSVEALLEALNKLSTQEIRVNFVRTGIGAITESDVLLASASDAIIIGFNVKPSPQAKILAEQEHVDIRFYDVIYHAIEEIKSAMAGLLEPVYKEKTMGRAEVRDVFRITKVGTVAGSYVLEGLIPRNAKARLLRDNIVVYNGKIASLRRFKEDIKEVRAGYECGIGLESFNDIKKGDIIEAFVMEKEVPVFGEAISDVKGKEVSE
jgi:translation initiation factor IF-2